MKQPILIIMAAGLGSRYGSLKQVAPVDDTGHILMDYAIYDAWRAGFRRLIFVITPQLEQEFHTHIGQGIRERMEVRYSYQLLDALPADFLMPQGRVKPWGTAHAVLSAKALVDAPFAVINADDYYGPASFQKIYRFLTTESGDTSYAMVGYHIENTVTENGHVARGVCQVDEDGYLQGIVERIHIEVQPEGVAFTEDGEHFYPIPAGTTVSMNMWGFGLSMMQEIEERFAGFLSANLPVNPLRCEYFLPLVPNQLLREGKVKIQVLPTTDKWYGVTYKTDMPVVCAALRRMKTERLYPESLWGNEQ